MSGCRPANPGQGQRPLVHVEHWHDRVARDAEHREISGMVEAAKEPVNEVRSLECPPLAELDLAAEACRTVEIDSEGIAADPVLGD